MASHANLGQIGLGYSYTRRQAKKKNNGPLSHLGSGQRILHINATVFGHHFVCNGLAVVVALAVHARTGNDVIATRSEKTDMQITTRS